MSPRLFHSTVSMSSYIIVAHRFLLKGGIAMANKTNCMINGKEYYRIRRKVGKKINSKGVWVDDYKLFYGKNKSEAEAKYKAFMDNLNKGITNKPLHFGEMMDTFITEVFLKDSRYTDSTKTRYVNAYNNNLKESSLAGLALSSIKSIDLQAAYNSLTCGASTVRSLHNLVTHFYRYLENENICRNITENIVLPKVNKTKGNAVSDGTIETWSSSEIKTILQESEGHRLHLLFVLALNTGCRIGELLALRYDDIADGTLRITKQVIISDEFVNGIKAGQKIQVSEPKTKASIRSIPLSDTVLDAVQNHKNWHTKEMSSNGYNTPYIFTTKTGNLYDKHTLRTACNRLYKRIGVPCRSFHVYRHTFGTTLAKKGVPIQTVAALMGHSDINVTRSYYINVDTEDKAAALSKLDF